MNTSSPASIRHSNRIAFTLRMHLQICFALGITHDRGIEGEELLVKPPNRVQV